MASKGDLDVVVIGAIGVDTNVYNLGGEIKFSKESNFTENIDYVGQAGGYTSRGFSQLGYKTGLIDYIGADHNGSYIKQTLEKDGIEILFFIDPKGTRRSINFMYKDGRRKNFYDGKSHMDLKPDLEKCRDFLSRTKLCHFNLMNWSRLLLPIAKELGLTISCDLQDIRNINDEYIQDFINYSDVLFFSSVNFEDPSPVMKFLHKWDPDKIIIAGMSEKGCALGYNNKISYYSPVKVIKYPVIDTNGAGDELVVGFLSSYFIERFSIEESIHRGQIAARYSCSIKGSSSNLITKQQLNKYFSELEGE